MNKKDCYDKVYTDVLNFLTNHPEYCLIYDNNLKGYRFSLKDFLNQDFQFLKNFFYFLPYSCYYQYNYFIVALKQLNDIDLHRLYTQYNDNYFIIALRELNDNDLKKIIKDLKKELLGDKK